MPSLLALAASWIGAAVTLIWIGGWAGIGLFAASSALGLCGYWAAGWPGVFVSAAAVFAIGLLA